MAAVRPEFRTEIYIPAPDDLVFAVGECAIGGCAASQHGLCNGHIIRWRQRRRRAMEEFLADPGRPVRGRNPLTPCAVDGCRYGGSSGGMCTKHSDRWKRAGKPDLATWAAPPLVTPGPARRNADCLFAPCGPKTQRRSSAKATRSAGPMPAEAQSRPVHRRLRADRHGPHRSARPVPAAEDGVSVCTAMPARYPGPRRPATHGDASGAPGQGRR